MRRLDQDPEVLALALRMGLDPALGPVRAVVEACLRWVEACFAGEPFPRSIRELEERLARRLGVMFEEVRSAAEFASLVARYTAEGEYVFAGLPGQFDADTFAALIRRRSLGVEGNARYVAVIDCRGTKAARRFFSRWHELAHLLTLPPTASTPVHRSTTEATGTERLMDVVAAELGFHETLFRPCLEAELARGGGLTFAGVDRVRAGYAPEASRQATLRACVNRLSAPVMLVEASLGFTKDEETRFELEPIPSRRPKPCLRVTQAMANAAARRCGLRIPLRMRVPAGSILSRAYFDANGEGPLGETTAEEDLGGWVHRDGTALPGQRVRVRVEPGRNSVWGLFFAGPSPAALPA